MKYQNKNQLKFNGNFNEILMDICFNPVAMSMKYQWKSIVNPVKNHSEIKLEIEIKMDIWNSIEITNEIQLSFQ